MKIALKKLRENAVLPRYQTALSAGMDVAACIDEPVIIAPHGRAIIPTGFAIALPAGYEAQIRGRSGMAAKFGIMPANGVGTIDADYRGEVQVLLVNLGQQPFTIRHGDRIAQLVVAPVAQARLVEVHSLDDTVRGAGGFGSTGVSDAALRQALGDSA